MPSVREIAELAGVSKSTVSLVLNNKPGVSDTMRKRIIDTVKALRENDVYHFPIISFDNQSKEQEKLSIVVLHPAILRSSQVFSELLRGIQEAANHFRIQLSLVVNEPNAPTDHISKIYFSDPSLKPDGVLVIGARQDSNLPKNVLDREIPCVLVGRSLGERKISAVGRDEEQIAFEATNYLFKHGHRKIAFIGGDEAFSYTQERIDGYKRAFSESLFVHNESWISLGDGKIAAKNILQNCPEISAAIFINDAYAIRALDVFLSHGWKIPEDLSVISFDDTELAKSFDPPITSIAHPLFQEGFRSLLLLLELIHNPQVKYANLVFHSKLIERESCLAMSSKER
jgi:LacI family transcriptional regulator